MTGPEIDLASIEAVLRADSPEPSPAFAAELDRRVAAGFPKPKRRGRFALPSFWIPALGAAALLVVALVVGLSSLERSDSDSQTASFASGKDAAAPNGIAPASPSFDPGTEDLMSGTPARATASSRHVVRSVDLTIATAHDRLQEAADGVGTIAESHGGFVLTSHVDTGDQGSGGTFTLRVPQSQLQATVADISKLGRLEARSENGQDVTAPYNDVQGKLGNALLERTALKLKLKHAKGTKADAIRVRLASLNAAIDSLGGRMKSLKQRTVYSTVNVTLAESKHAAGGTGAAWDDAQRTLEGMLNFALRALAVILPLGLFAALAALAGRSLRRRRREAPLL